MRRAASALLAFGAAALWSPSIVLACPVCFSATEANRDAFLGTTVLLSLLPLAFVGGVLFFLVAQAREREAVADDAATSPADPNSARTSGDATSVSLSSNELRARETLPEKIT